ncbi:hypothetical protein ABZT11_37685, partial [Streptomyces avermitilis]
GVCWGWLPRGRPRSSTTTGSCMRRRADVTPPEAAVEHLRDKYMLRSRYVEITQRRNKIAHDADLIDGDLKQRRPVDDASVNDAIDWTEHIAPAIAHLLDDEG